MRLHIIYQNINLTFQSQEDLGIPAGLSLPLSTSETYVPRFLNILRTILSELPPERPTESAVNLLVIVADMQR
jgi:hypothetical protein